MQKLPLKEKCLTATANYHPGIRYIMMEYNAKYIYSSTYARFR
ncbi:TPA: protein YmiD [Escherichia coli]